MAEKDTGRQSGRRRETTEPDEPAAGGIAKAEAEAGQLAADQVGATMDQMRELGAEASSLGPLGVGETAAESDITNELSGGGVAFGEFTKSVGLAVSTRRWSTRPRRCPRPRSTPSPSSSSRSRTTTAPWTRASSTSRSCR